jgi:tellurite resistance protein
MRSDDFGGEWEHQLRSLAKRLKVPDETVVQAIKSAAKRLLREACERAVVDGNVTSQETQELISLRQRVGLDEREHAAIFLVAAQTYAQQLFEQAMADGKLNPQEESELAGLAQALGVAFDYDQVAHKAIENARKRWQIEHGVLSTVAAPINLQRGERCYAWLEAEALESRERTISTRYGGPAVSFRIMKGVYYRAGAYRTERIRKSYHHSFGIGSLCVTSRRLAFSSPQKGISIPWVRILDCVAYVDGVEVRRGNGKPLVFLFRRDDEFFLPILNRAMSGT